MTTSLSHRSHATLLSALMLATAQLLGCSDASDDDDAEPSAWLPPVALAEHVLLVDSEGDEGFLFDTTDGREAAVSRFALAPNPIWLGMRERHSSALVLSAGRRGVDGSGVLTLVRDSGKTREYPLGAPFNQIAQSDDGRFAVAYFERGPLDIAFSPNEIVVVDLQAEGEADAMTRKTLRTPLGTLGTLVASPELRMAGERAHVAVGTSPGYVSILDLEHPDRPDILVQLGDASVEPRQVLFGARRGQLYVRASGSDDVFVMSLEEARQERANRFWPSVEQATVGAGFSAMAVAGAGSDSHLVALATVKNELHLIADAASEASSVGLERSASGLLGFDLEVDENDDSAALALAYDSTAAGVTFVDALALTTDPFAAIDAVETAGPATAVILLEKQERALVFHAGSALSVIDLRNHSARTLSVNTALTDVVHDEDVSALVVAPAHSHLLSVVDLDTGAAQEVLLDDPIVSAVMIPETARLAVVHPDDRLTLLDLEDPSRDDASTIAEFR